jgi:YgiT-type zinc finger domain-containing protein
MGAISQEEKKMICRSSRHEGREVETKKEPTTQTYTRKGSDVTVVVEGIPAEVCPECGEVYIDLEVAKQLDLFVHPLLEFGRGRHSLAMPWVKVELAPRLPEAA